MALERTFTIDRILMLAGRPGHENISGLRTSLKWLVATGYAAETGWSKALVQGTLAKHVAGAGSRTNAADL